MKKLKNKMKPTKKMTILIGDWPGHFIKKVKLFEKIEEKFNCKIKKKGTFVYETKINDNKLIFQFCFGPADDKVWRERKRIREKDGSKLPPSIGHLAKKGIKADEIYYLGFCGVLKGRRQRFFLPNKFLRVNFEECIIKNKHLSKLKISKGINYPNKLISVLRGRKCTLVTSNQVLSLKYIENNSEEVLKTISKKLKSHADVVEMENYEIIKHFGRTNQIGILLYGTDVPANKKKMLGKSNFKKFNWNKFNKTGLKLIQEIVR